MARPTKAAKSEAVTAAEGNGASIGDIDAIEDGKIFDYTLLRSESGISLVL
jgi:hypothetical protein